MPVVRELIRRKRGDVTVVGPASSGLDVTCSWRPECARKLVNCYFDAKTLTPISPMFQRQIIGKAMGL